MGKRALIPILGAWILLGGYRGMKSYDFQYKRKLNDYEEKVNRNPEWHSKFYDKPTYLYLERAANGIIGATVYINPFLFPYFFYVEIYRLEVNLRNLEDEKKTAKYNEL